MRIVLEQSEYLAEANILIVMAYGNQNQVIINLKMYQLIDVQYIKMEEYKNYDK